MSFAHFGAGMDSCREERQGRQDVYKRQVMITHNEAVAQLADRIIHIEDGKIVGGNRLEGSF